jgi:hypothetical protein
LHFIAVSKPDSDSNAYLNSCSNFKTATINIADAEFTVVYRPLRRKQELERISRSMVL